MKWRSASILVLFSLLVFSQSALATWRQANVNYNVNLNPQLIEVMIFNNDLGPIECRGAVYGITQYGHTAIQNFHFPRIRMGEFQRAYVYAFGSIYFVNGWADVKCRKKFIDDTDEDVW